MTTEQNNQPEPEKDPRPAEVVQERCTGRLADLRTLYDLYTEDTEANDDNLGNLHDYALCFDYVEPDTFTDQAEGYYRYQLSWGGPSQEIRYFVSRTGDGYEVGHLHHTPYRIEFWHMDWGDGASVDITADKTALDIWGFLSEGLC